MSNIFVAKYSEPMQASHVLDDLERGLADWADDLENTAVVRWHNGGAMLIQLRVHLLNGSGANWGRLWGSLLGVALLVPYTGELLLATQSVEDAFQDRHPDVLNRLPAHHGTHFWLDGLAIPGNFLRDMGALIRPGTSALLMFVRKGDPTILARRLREHGGTLLSLAMSQAQDAEITALLESTRQHPKPALPPARMPIAQR